MSLHPQNPHHAVIRRHRRTGIRDRAHGHSVDVDVAAITQIGLPLRQAALRSGRDLTDLYRALVTGISGTPMPSFADALTEEQKWRLIAFIETLRRDLRSQK